MKRKDLTVETEFHHILTAFLFEADELYRSWNSELILTSGSEQSTKHSTITSLHHATPCQAADIRIWEIEIVPSPVLQQISLIDIAEKFCNSNDIHISWLEIILESNHIHIEYQPKRIL